MTRTLLLSPLLILLSGHCHCQENAPTFEVAAITPCPPGTADPPGHPGMFQFTFPGGRFDARAATVTSLIEWAYDVLPSQHSGGPAWMDNDRYDIAAKAGSNATDAEMKMMTQSLLADRFKLKMHRETRDAPVLILTVGKTAPKLYPPKDGEQHSLRVVPKLGDDRKVIAYQVLATRFSFLELNQVFARQLERVIVNRTGRDGDFDFTLDLVLDDHTPNPLDPSLLISALRDQLGLVLKSQKAPVDFLTIESVEKANGGN